LPVAARVAIGRVEPRSPSPVASATRTELVVLCSSSSANQSILVHGEGRTRRVTLVDAGCSPTRTRKMLAPMGLELDHIDDVVLTHLDTDHCHPGWGKALPNHARFRILRSHRGRAKRIGLTKRRTYVFDDGEPFELGHGATITPMTLDHDDLGVAVFRMDFDRAPGERSSLGYATDLGRITTGLVEHLRGVDVLAIESNYCPRMQADSDRPDFLKRRIMGGAGHLSNEECRAAITAIAPTRHVVLLHLSRECNTPALAGRYHVDTPYELTIASPDAPTAAIRLA